jgi:hypothetical protein
MSTKESPPVNAETLGDGRTLVTYSGVRPQRQSSFIAGSIGLLLGAPIFIAIFFGVLFLIFGKFSVALPLIFGGGIGVLILLKFSAPLLVLQHRLIVSETDFDFNGNVYRFADIDSIGHGQGGVYIVCAGARTYFGHTSADVAEAIYLRIMRHSSGLRTAFGK